MYRQWRDMLQYYIVDKQYLLLFYAVIYLFLKKNIYSVRLYIHSISLIDLFNPKQLYKNQIYSYINKIIFSEKQNKLLKTTNYSFNVFKIMPE